MVAAVVSCLVALLIARFVLGILGLLLDEKCRDTWRHVVDYST